MQEDFRYFHVDNFRALNYNEAVMKFTELTVHTTTEASELIADAMWEFSPYGVTVCDKNDIIALQKNSPVFWDYMDESALVPQTDVLVKCYFEPDRAEELIQAVMKEICARRDNAAGFLDYGTLEEVKREIEGDDWIDVWKKHFRPIHLNKIVVVPEWIEYEKKEGEEIVLLDSNMAFGTGEHETTSMCVELLQKYLKAGDTCIDVGCGSGILGISAAKLGAGYCYLSDLDPIAVESATHNAIKNGVAEKVTVAGANLLEGAQVTADIALANITAEVLIMLAPSVAKHIKDNGILILSGIIKERLQAVKDVYRKIGFALSEEREKGAWFALVLRKEGKA